MPIDRPRGVLSRADRRYLTNPDEYSKQAGYERRQAIIERIQEGLQDFSLLVSTLDEDSRARAFSPEGLQHNESPLNGVRSALAFLYLGVTDTVEVQELAKDAFEQAVEDGIKEAYLRQGVSVRTVTADIEVETGPPAEELLEKDELASDEVFQLIQAGVIPQEEAVEVLHRLMQERMDGPTGGESRDGEVRHPVAPFAALVENGGPKEDTTGGGESDIYDPTDEFEG